MKNQASSFFVRLKDDTKAKRNKNNLKTTVENGADTRLAMMPSIYADLRHDKKTRRRVLIST